MWGSALDQVLEVEVVTADGEIRRANETHNTDLFWAIRGAGPSFGIVTEYVVKTHAAPGEIVEYTYSLSFGTQKEMIPIYKKWQALASDPELDRRFSSQFIAQPLGALITGTFYGSEAEFKATGILEKLPKGSNISFDIFDWKADLVHQAELAGLALAGIPIAFDTKSLAIPQENLLDDDQIETLFTYMDQKKWLGLLWVVIFNTEGGAMGDRTNDETAYSHRDSVIMYQSYGIGITKVSQRTHEFIGGVHESMQLGGANHTYVGYIAPGMDRASAQEFYWGENLPRLRELKSKWDPRDIFRNPQSIEPLKSTE
jgi:FAD/FMN-containing dehydrogenase